MYIQTIVCATFLLTQTYNFTIVITFLCLCTHSVKQKGIGFSTKQKILKSFGKYASGLKTAKQCTFAAFWYKNGVVVKAVKPIRHLQSEIFTKCRKVEVTPPAYNLFFLWLYSIVLFPFCTPTKREIRWLISFDIQYTKQKAYHLPRFCIDKN